MRTTRVASRDESKLSSVKLFFWENLDERQRRRECEGQLPIRIRLTFHARFRYFSPPTLQFYLLLFYIPFSLLLFPIYTTDFTDLRNIINKYQTRLISTRFVRIFPRYLQLIGSKVSSGQRREKKNRWISFRATRHLRVAPSRFHGGRHVPKWHVPRGVRACPPTRLEEVHPSRVHRSRRKAVVGSPRWSTTGDTRDTRFPVGFTLLFAFLLLLRRPRRRRRRRRGRGIRFSEPGTPTLYLLHSLRLRTSSHFRRSPRCHWHWRNKRD